MNTTFNQGPNVQLDSSVVPNPFAGVGIDYEDSNQSVLRKLDGGLDGEVDAVEPLIVPGRAVDCLVVVDGVRLFLPFVLALAHFFRVRRRPIRE